MRIIAFLLAGYMSFMMLSPALCMTYNILKQVESCCNSERQCSKEHDKGKQNNCIPCCSIQNCNYYIITSPKIDFSPKGFTTVPKAALKNDKIISKYFSDCWQPPEYFNSIFFS